MLPILPFTAGLIAGVAAIGLLRGERARAEAAKLQDGLRQAGASGLDAVRRSAVVLRQRFAVPDTPTRRAADTTAGEAAAPPGAAPAETAAMPPANTPKSALPPSRARRRKTPPADTGAAA